MSVLGTASCVRWEWRLFEADWRIHLYRVQELELPRLALLTPWCLLNVSFPLEHDRTEVGMRGAFPRGVRACPACEVRNGARIPHPRVGTELAGGFTGRLFEVVTRVGAERA